MKVANTKSFKHVSYLWDPSEAEKFGDDEVAQLIYRSNLLGADLRLTNYGGGNTSCKVMSHDPITNERVEVMYVKGSGGDLGTLKKNGLAALYVDRVMKLRKVYRGLEYEDEMVELLNHCIYDLASKAPSIDTPLHAFLPHKHIDHLHPDAAIAIAASKDGKRITQELFNGTVGWVDWQRPGFDLGLKLRQCVEENPLIRGIMLGSHGLFTWGDTAYESYMNTLEVIERCSEFLREQYGKSRPVFGGQKLNSPTHEQRLNYAAKVAPVLRGLCSSKNRMIGHFTDDERVLEFINSSDVARLAPMGTSCPDHFLRTKINPMILKLDPSDSFDSKKAAREIQPQIEEYRHNYAAYYHECKSYDSPAMRDQNPVVILWPGIGMFTFARDKQTARVASEFYINAINVMKGAEAISTYIALPRQEAFNIEYWVLEEAKLQRMPKPKPLTSKIALITGSAGGIGKAIARKFIEEGACVMLCDNDEKRLAEARNEFSTLFNKDNFSTASADVRASKDLVDLVDHCAVTFGGIDIVVNNAGLSISKSLGDHSEEDWDILYDVLVKGQFLTTQKAVEVMQKQFLGGDIINIVSKNALVSGPNNAGYGSAKAAQLHMSRLLAAELGAQKIRVNVVNPDAVIADSKIWSSGWAEGRAKAYGITVAELPAFYAKRTILNEVIEPCDVANACFALVGGLLNKSTGNIISVDGGIAAAFAR